MRRISQTGNIEKGKQYFNGAGKCNSCHSPTGDLAGVATRNEGLKLMQRLLYPARREGEDDGHAASGETVTGERAPIRTSSPWPCAMPPAAIVPGLPRK